jgi:hypothetical protein
MVRQQNSSAPYCEQVKFGGLHEVAFKERQTHDRRIPFGTLKERGNSPQVDLELSFTMKLQQEPYIPKGT